MKHFLLTTILACSPVLVHADETAELAEEYRLFLDSQSVGIIEDFADIFDVHFPTGTYDSTVPIDLVRATVGLVEGQWFNVAIGFNTGEFEPEQFERFCERRFMEFRPIDDFSFEMVRINRDGSDGYSVRYSHTYNLHFSKSVDTAAALSFYLPDDAAERLDQSVLFNTLSGPIHSGISTVRFHSPDLLVIQHPGSVVEILARCPE